MQLNINQLARILICPCDRASVLISTQPQHPTPGHPIMFLPLLWRRLQHIQLARLASIWQQEINITGRKREEKEIAQQPDSELDSFEPE